MGEVNAAGLGSQAEQVTVAVEAPSASGTRPHLERALVAAVEELFPRLVAGISVGERDGLVAMPRGGHDGDWSGRFDAVRDCSGYEVFQQRHEFTLGELERLGVP